MKTYIGITNKCNAKCFTCNRQVFTNYQYNDDMSLSTLVKILKDSEEITYIGEMGDFIFHKHSLEIARMTIEDYNIPMNVDTIGNIHDDTYWTKLGKLCSKGDSFVRFMIDGIGESDPHRQINNKDVLHNLKIFIDAGGHAKIKTILFNFNQDEIETMKLLFQSMGVKEYSTIRSRLYKESGPLSAPKGQKASLNIMDSLKLKSPEFCPWHKHNMVYINEFGELKVCCHLVFEGIPFADLIDPSIDHFIGLPMFNDIIQLYMNNRDQINLNNNDVTMKSAYNNEFNQFMINHYDNIKICKFRCGIKESLQNRIFYENKIF